MSRSSSHRGGPSEATVTTESTLLSRWEGHTPRCLSSGLFVFAVTCLALLSPWPSVFFSLSLGSHSLSLFVLSLR